MAYIGMLEVFKEQGIEIDMIAATSSASFVACAYSAGTMEKLKEIYFEMSFKELLALFEPTFKGGIFSLDGIEETARKFLTQKDLEELPLPVAIIAADIIHGEEVVFRMGDIMRAIKASCAMPGLFEPVIWGDKVLIDGGTFTIIPVEAAHAWGADLVIGVDMSTSKDIFDSKLLHLKRGYNFLKKPIIGILYGATVLKEYFFPAPQQKEKNIDHIKVPSLATVFGKAVDHAIYQRRKTEFIDCDLVIRPNIKGYGDLDMGKMEAIYEEGREAAKEALPAIKALLAE